MTARIRKQVQDLTSQDFDLHPRWICATDEEDEPDHDECTVRPLGLGETPHTSQQIMVQAVFFFPNGRVRLGMVTLNAGNDPSGHQPCLFSPGSTVNFYNGATKPTAKELSQFTKALRSVAPQPYPVRYVSSLSEPNGRPLAYGELHGLYWLINWRTSELAIAA